MIVKIVGKVEAIGEDFFDLEVSGITYRIFVNKNFIMSSSEIGEILNIHVYEMIKEDLRLFFGFKSQSERNLFTDLLVVQGVGGKMALNIMSQLTYNQIVESIINEKNANFLTISGVGKKLSLRIVNELRERILKKNKDLEFNDYSIKSDKNLLDLVSCLENLGYPHKLSREISERVLSENNEKKLENLIPIALKYIKNKPNQ